MKKLIAFIAVLAVVLYMAPSKVQAARVGNYRTGYNSTNNVSRNDAKTYNHGASRTGGVLNIDVALADTGNNTTDNNTVGENKVQTGNTVASVDSDDLVNLSLLTVTQSEPPETDVVENDTTGNNSINNASINRTRNASFSETSTGGVLNVSVAVLNTGGNSASGNTTGANSVDTGNATSNVNHASDVNGSEVIINQ